MEEEETEGSGRPCGGDLTYKRCHRGPMAGGGACPRDRCCPNLVLESGDTTCEPVKREGIQGRKRKTKKYKPTAQGGNSDGRPGNGVDSEELPQSISFRCLAASIPRWILATRTRFACYLSRTFHIQCGSATPSSVVFPLPLADFNLFAGGGPKLSSRRWMTLLRKRLLHVLIVALNYLHDGFRGADISLLGRRPNSMQRAIHHRLWSLIAACDAPGVFPLSPGRSGDEFIAGFVCWRILRSHVLQLVKRSMEKDLRILRRRRGLLLESAYLVQRRQGMVVVMRSLILTGHWMSAA